MEGSSVVGDTLGECDGPTEGLEVGLEKDGFLVGSTVGPVEGAHEG
jgi:hypothetical protein